MYLVREIKQTSYGSETGHHSVWFICARPAFADISDTRITLKAKLKYVHQIIYNNKNQSISLIFVVILYRQCETLMGIVTVVIHPPNSSYFETISIKTTR